MHRKSALPTIVARLRKTYAVAPALSDPFLHILWENIGYLIDDERRSALFAEFHDTIGFDAAALVSAPRSRLAQIAQRGGMNPEMRIERWREIGAIVTQECAGDLAAFLRSLPAAKARGFLKRFPAIGDSAADRILLFCGLDVRPSVDSNGLRVLVRLGLVPRAASYAATYKAAVAAIAQNAARGRDWLMTCHTLLREHGRALCKRNNPRCMACPLDALCAHAPAKGL